jgi:hypothetical protein
MPSGLARSTPQLPQESERPAQYVGNVPGSTVYYLSVLPTLPRLAHGALPFILQRGD